jgi:hypothetical protein
MALNTFHQYRPGAPEFPDLRPLVHPACTHKDIDRKRRAYKRVATCDQCGRTLAIGRKATG